MPNPLETAMVIAGGMQYTNWTNVAVERSYDQVVAHATLTVVEGPIKSGTMGPITALRLSVGTPVTVLLAGQLAITGQVTVRQPSYSAEAHGVQLVVSSLTQNVTISTVDAAPGQYLNQNLQSIASAVFGKVGVGFSIVGSPPGANKLFPRISEQIGETRFTFIERLGRMRNLHLIDDGKGSCLATREPGGMAAQLIEGQNILRARAIMSINDSAESLTAVGQAPPMPMGGMGDMSSTATTTVPDVKLTRPVKFACEINADNADCAMRANHELDQTKFDQLECTITVRDWLMPGGDLWINHVNDQVTVDSPMLFPDNVATLYIRGVVHRQSSEEGTTTDLLLSQFPGGESLIADDAADTPPAVDIHPGL
jgi:prophage tail gpP-like protein